MRTVMCLQRTINIKHLLRRPRVLPLCLNQRIPACFHTLETPYFMFSSDILILLLGLAWIPFHEIKAAFFLSVPETLKLLHGELTKGEINNNNDDNRVTITEGSSLITEQMNRECTASFNLKK